MTVSVPDEVLAKFKKGFPEINVAEIVRAGIIKKLKELERLEELKEKGKI